MNITSLALKNLSRHKTRSALSIFTIVIACILGLFLLTLITGMKADLKRNILTYYTGSVQVRNAQYNQYDYLSPLHLYIRDQAAVREKLLRIDGVSHAVPRISAGGKIYLDEDQYDDIPGEKYSAMAMGIDFPAERKLIRPESLLVEGKLPLMGSRQVLLGRGLAEKTGLKPGSTFAFLTQTAARGVNAMSFEVSGLVRFSIAELNNTSILLPFDTMQGFVRMDGGAQEILLMTEEADNPEPQLARIKSLIAADSSLDYLEAKSWKEHGEMYSYMGLATIVYNFIVLFFLLFGATVIINTTMMAVYDRYREIGILGAMGMTPKEITRLFFVEALFAGIISAVIGLLLGSLIILNLEKTGMDFEAAFGGVNIEVSTILYPDLRFFHLILMGFYTIGIAALVTLIPCRRAAKIEPVDAINSI